ncbi:hypothetical protein A2714_04480 [Candidatus Woesebacteria bacterium RIFCSPHIGHO2_01_FULL_38_9]|uniref:Uncharacterized protein n=2 Tax=Candidatus Woeseibacteriota TaxID=1752722 RepID=A0A1F7Y1M9_9BACT|nr:MAG: hypothetical protein A2714_04480 [Candidatus Woesebacteria bacterium RIFCSPHIGHO2_01_FULL_38_9]OGM58339.1 MAG: hypothetical protein A3A75_04900 [Candidatus Woesebacteria bacterium RIFCSPLOWO2_01_FULL_39_10]
MREKPEVIENLLRLYSNLEESPEAKMEKAVEIRKIEEEKIKKPFLSLIKFSQQYVTLREDRRFYEFLADYDLRQILISLGGKIGLEKPEDIFNLSWKEIKIRAR